MKNLILFLVAVFLFIIIFPISLIYLVFDVLFEMFGKLAIILDFAGNVLLARIFNDWAIEKGGYEFGKTGETISSALGKNQKRGKLTVMGKNLCKVLDYIEENHCEKSINNKI